MPHVVGLCGTRGAPKYLRGGRKWANPLENVSIFSFVELHCLIYNAEPPYPPLDFEINERHLKYTLKRSHLKKR